MKGSHILAGAFVAFILFCLIWPTFALEHNWPCPQSLQNEQTMLGGTELGLFLAFSGMIAFFGWGHMKSKTGVLVADGMKWPINIHDGVVPVGPFDIHPLEGILTSGDGVSIAGRGGACIYPRMAGVVRGNNIIVRARVKRVPFRRLPPAVQDALHDHGIKGPYYIGYAPSFIQIFDVDFTKSIREFEIENSRRSYVEKAQSSALLGTDQAVRHLKRQVDRITTPNKMRGFWDRITSTPDDDAAQPHPEDERSR